MNQNWSITKIGPQFFQTKKYIVNTKGIFFRVPLNGASEASQYHWSQGIEMPDDPQGNSFHRWCGQFNIGFGGGSLKVYSTLFRFVCKKVQRALDKWKRYRVRQLRGWIHESQKETTGFVIIVFCKYVLYALCSKTIRWSKVDY